MRFYKNTHAFYAGVDLHARSMFTHILDHAGTTVFERDLPASPESSRNRAFSCRPGRRRRVHVRLVLARRSVRVGRARRTERTSESRSSVINKAFSWPSI